MDTARLRKAFRYPGDSEDDEGYDREELDEEEQERLVRQLHMRNDKCDAEYTIIFAVIPLVAAVTFVPSIFSRSAGLLERLLSSLSTLSLIATAYTMKYTPLRRPDLKGKKPVRNLDLSTRIRTSVLPLNAVLCGLLVLLHAVSSRTDPPLSSQSFFTSLVPGAILIVIVIVREVMVSVDIKPLENLRYDYKGA